MSANEEHVSYCHNCHRIDFSDADACPLCNGPLTTDRPKKEEIKDYSREAHNRNLAGYDKAQNAGCFLVIGGMIFVIGILFIFLSLQKKMNKIVGINFASFQFVVCVACLSIGLTLLIIGFVSLIKAQKKRHLAQKEIDYLTALDKSLPKV